MPPTARSSSWPIHMVGTMLSTSYERGMSLWEVQKMLGHDRPTTTVSYLATAHADPEKASLAAAGRAVQRLTMDKGNLR
jgi:integrase/recombinase XerC